LSDESEEFSIGASSSDELEDESESEEESDDEFGLPSSRANGTSLASGCWSPIGSFMFLTTIGLGWLGEIPIASVHGDSILLLLLL